MPLTITPIHDPTGAEMGVFNIVCDNSYVANGYPLSAASFGRKSLSCVVPIQKGTASRILTWDGTPGDNGLLRVWTAISTEATGASDQSSVSCVALVIGPRA